MKLTIAERFNLLELLPKESDFITMKKIKELSEKLTPTDKEIKTYEIELEYLPTGGARWKYNKKGNNYKVDISIGEICEKELIAVLKKKNEEKTLKIFEISLYEKFIEKTFEKEKN